MPPPLAGRQVSGQESCENSFSSESPRAERRRGRGGTLTPRPTQPSNRLRSLLTVAEGGWRRARDVEDLSSIPLTTKGPLPLVKVT